MPITFLTCPPSLRRRETRPPPQYELFDEAVDLAAQGKSLESLAKTFEFLFPDRELPDLATTAFSFTQGSSSVHLRLDGDEVEISVPVARMPSGGAAIAALRYVLSRIAASGQLHQPVLRGDDLFLEHRSRLSHLHPSKLTEILRRMPFAADYNDDWLIEQFAAQPLDRAEIGELDDEEFRRCQEIWNIHWDVLEELLGETQRKRSMFLLNQVTAYAVHHLRYTLPLTGYLNARIDEFANTFNSTNVDPMRREESLAKCVKEMKAVPADKLRRSLAHVEYAISPNSEGTRELLESFFVKGNFIENINGHRNSGKPMEAALALISSYNYLLARFSWPRAVEAALVEGLAVASGKPWREAANELWDHTQNLVDEFLGDEDEENESNAAQGSRS